ncbi:hypothetical protein KAZ82_01565 [Candidatus Babeliales bacterium]|nr:hypothetical protein [Candidatus Babeliales bacterium]
MIVFCLFLFQGYVQASCCKKIKIRFQPVVNEQNSTVLTRQNFKVVFSEEATRRLCLAVDDENVAKIRTAIKDGADVNTIKDVADIGRGFVSLIQYAAFFQRYQSVKQLLIAGARVECLVSCHDKGSYLWEDTVFGYNKTIKERNKTFSKALKILFRKKLSHDISGIIAQYLYWPIIQEKMHFRVCFAARRNTFYRICTASLDQVAQDVWQERLIRKHYFYDRDIIIICSNPSKHVPIECDYTSDQDCPDCKIIYVKFKS